MKQSPFYTSNGFKNSHFSNPALQVHQNRQSPLTSYSGIALMREVVEKLDIAQTINTQLHMMKRHKPYHESDHILMIVYNLLTGGETLSDIQRLQTQEGFKRILGARSIPDPTTTGDFLARFSESDVQAMVKVNAEAQDRAWQRMDRRSRDRATVDFDSSIHEVYGNKKEGADYSYTNTWSYHVLYGIVAETGEVVHQQLREGSATSSRGTAEALPAIMHRLKRFFSGIRFRADAGFYDKRHVEICEHHGAEFFIVAKQAQPIVRQILAIPEEAWKPLPAKKIRTSKSGKRRTKRKNHKRVITVRRKPDSMFRGGTQVASFHYQPGGWSKGYRYVVTRTEVVDKDNKQLYLAEDLCRYLYHVVVTNTSYSDSRVICIAHGRSNQENLIKGLKHGMGLSHVPTGRFLANKAYFLIAALAWNIKAWMLSLLKLGEAAKLRFKRFLYLWIYQESVVSCTARGAVALRMDAGEYLQTFTRALSQAARL